MLLSKAYLICRERVINLFFRSANVCHYVLVINREYLMRPRQVTTSLCASSGRFGPGARYLGGVA